MRSALLALVMLPALAHPAFADKCIASLTYQQKGGDLDKLAFPEDVPDRAKRCETANCDLQADIALVVQRDGSVRDVVVTMTDGRGTPVLDSAEAMRQWLSSLHFEPPALKGKPVCVNLEWSFGFAQRKSRSTP